MMNDRFMVRYWCKDSKKYLDSHKLVYNDGTYTQVGTKQSPNGTYHSYIVCDWNTSELIPEQSTGLRDKNGNLIYEGDIVFINGEKWRVIRDDEDCAFFFSNLKEVYHQPIFPDFYMGAEDFKVIGNIHEENPDSLIEREE